MQPAEIISLAADNKILISLAGADLIVADKFPYTEMVDPDELTLVNMYNHTPGWLTQAQYRVKKEEPEQTWSGYEKKVVAQPSETTSAQPNSTTRAKPSHTQPAAQPTAANTHNSQEDAFAENVDPSVLRTSDDDFAEAEDITPEAEPASKDGKSGKSQPSFARSNIGSSCLSDF